MISVCTKVEIKFEKEVENKNLSNKLSCFDENSWKKRLYFLPIKSVNKFISNMVKFYEPMNNEELERIFLAKHQILFADYKKKKFF